MGLDGAVATADGPAFRVKRSLRGAFCCMTSSRTMVMEIPVETCLPPPHCTLPLCWWSFT